VAHFEWPDIGTSTGVKIAALDLHPMCEYITRVDGPDSRARANESEDLEIKSGCFHRQELWGAVQREVRESKLPEEAPTAYANTSASRSLAPFRSFSDTIASASVIGQGIANSGSFQTIVRSPAGA